MHSGDNKDDDTIPPSPPPGDDPNFAMLNSEIDSLIAVMLAAEAQQNTISGAKKAAALKLFNDAFRRINHHADTTDFRTEQAKNVITQKLKAIDSNIQKAAKDLADELTAAADKHLQEIAALNPAQLRDSNVIKKAVDENKNLISMLSNLLSLGHRFADLHEKLSSTLETLEEKMEPQSPEEKADDNVQRLLKEIDAVLSGINTYFNDTSVQRGEKVQKLEGYYKLLDQLREDAKSVGDENVLKLRIDNEIKAIAKLLETTKVTLAESLSQATEQFVSAVNQLVAKQSDTSISTDLFIAEVKNFRVFYRVTTESLLKLSTYPTYQEIDSSDPIVTQEQLMNTQRVLQGCERVLNGLEVSAAARKIMSAIEQLHKDITHFDLESKNSPNNLTIEAKAKNVSDFDQDLKIFRDAFSDNRQIYMIEIGQDYHPTTIEWLEKTLNDARVKLQSSRETVVNQLQTETRQLAALVRNYKNTNVSAPGEVTDTLNKLLAAATNLSVAEVQQELSKIQTALRAPQPSAPRSRRGSRVEGALEDDEAPENKYDDEEKDEEEKDEKAKNKDENEEKKQQARPRRAPSIDGADEYKPLEKDIAVMPFSLLEADDKSLGKILYDGLTSEEPAVQATAFKSLLNFAENVDQATQIEFINLLYGKLDLHKHVTLAAYINGEEKLPDIAKKLKTDPAGIAANGKSNKDNYKTLIKDIFKELRDDRLEIPAIDYEQPFGWIHLINTLSKPLHNNITKKPHLGNILNAIVPQLGLDKDSAGNVIPVTNVQLRDVFEAQGITNARWVSTKLGGANDPGEEGGNYSHVYMDADGILQFPVVFYKEPNDEDKKNPNGPRLINYQEGIAEVLGGRIMNRLYGDVSAPLYAIPILDDQGKRTNHVYAASVFHKAFTDLHEFAFEYLNFKSPKGVKTEKRGKKGDPLTKKAFNEIFLGGGTYAHKVKATHSDGKEIPGGAEKYAATDRAALRKSLGVAAMSSIFVGNYQIHSQNLGVALVKDKNGVESLQVVSLDYGGAMRPDYKFSAAVAMKNFEPSFSWKKIKKTVVTEAKAHGRFERAIRPLDTHGKKYHIAYLKQHFDKEIYLSKEFIAGVESVGNQSQQSIKDAVNAEVKNSIEKYGAGVFFDNFAATLDKRTKATIFKNPPLLPFNGREPTDAEVKRIISETSEYLRDNLLARRLSTKEFALELKLEAAKDIKDKALQQQEMYALAKENPLYALKNADKFLGVKVDTQFLTNLYTSEPGQPVLEAMINELNLLKFSKNEKSGIRRIAEIAEKRLNIALQTILEQDPETNLDKINFADKNAIIEELTAIKLQLNYALLSDNYTSSMDYNIIALMTDEVFRGIKNLCAKIPTANLQAFIDKQIEMTPKNSQAPGDKKPWSITTSKAANLYYSETSKSSIYNLSGGMEARPSPSPSPPPSPSSQSSSSSSSSRSSGGRPASPSMLGMFTHKIQKSFTDFLSDFVVKISHTFNKDKVARDALKQYVNSSIGSQELRNDNNVILQNVKNLISGAKFSNILLPKNILRTPLMNEAEFTSQYVSAEKVADKPPIKVADLLSKAAPSLNDAPPQTENYYALNFMKSAAVASSDNTKGWASFLEERVNNVYSIKAITLPPEVSRNFLLETHLQGATPVLIKNLREALRDIEIAAFKGATEADHNQSLNTEITKLLKNANVDDTQINAFLAAYDKNCRQVIASSAIPANGYLEFVQAQLQKFMAEAGSNKTVRITPTNDPLLAQAYILICKANNIKYNNKSGFEFTESANNREVMKHIKTNFTVDASTTLTAIKDLLHEMDKKLEKISAPVDNKKLENDLANFKSEVNTFKAKVDKGEYISSEDLYKLINKISVTTTENEEKLSQPRPDPKRSGSF